MNNINRTNINDPVAVEKLLSFRRRQYTQAMLEVKQRPARAAYLQSTVIPRIVQKGKWAAAQLQRINSRVVSETQSSMAAM